MTDTLESKFPEQETKIPIFDRFREKVYGSENPCGGEISPPPDDPLESEEEFDPDVPSGDYEVKEFFKPDSLAESFIFLSILQAETKQDERYFMPDQIALRLSRAWSRTLNSVISALLPNFDMSPKMEKIVETVFEPIARTMEYTTGVYRGVYKHSKYRKRHKLTYDGIGDFYEKVGQAEQEIREKANGRNKNPKKTKQEQK